jgi:inner membrane protein
MESNLKSSVLLRMVLVVVLTLVLLIPQMMIESLVTERQERRDSVVKEVNEKWGKDQTFTGPVLVLPFQRMKKDDKGKTYTEQDQIILLPKVLTAEINMHPEVRYRSIFETVLYSSAISVQAEFSLEPIQKLSASTDMIQWNDVSLVLGISDLKGIHDTVAIQWEGKPVTATPGVIAHDIIPSGLSAGVKLSPSQNVYKCELHLSLNGSSDFQVIPVGEQTAVKIEGNWGNPSFSGEFLPLERTVSQESFQAVWKILNLNRAFPQAFFAGQYKVESSAFGVKLLVPIDEYQKTMRTTKYAIMFIVLMFVAFFISEILSSRAIHPIQYSLIGFALLLFYVLLLSLSEHLLFFVSYLIASLSVISLVTLYTRSMLGRLNSLVLGGILIALYGFLYVIVQAQDYALLFGSCGLFLALAAVMYLTRRIDWFMIGKKEE